MDLLSDTKKLQHRLTEKHVKTVLHMIDNSSMKDAARLRSLQGKGSGAWLECIPSSQELALSPGLFHLAAFVRLDLLIPLPSSVEICKCRKPLDDERIPSHHL